MRRENGGGARVDVQFWYFGGCFWVCFFGCFYKTKLFLESFKLLPHMVFIDELCTSKTGQKQACQTDLRIIDTDQKNIVIGLHQKFLSIRKKHKFRFQMQTTRR